MEKLNPKARREIEEVLKETERPSLSFIYHINWPRLKDPIITLGLISVTGVAVGVLSKLFGSSIVIDSKPHKLWLRRKEGILT